MSLLFWYAWLIVPNWSSPMRKVQGYCQLRIAGKSISLEVITPDWVYIVAPLNPEEVILCEDAKTLSQGSPFGLVLIDNHVLKNRNGCPGHRSLSEIAVFSPLVLTRVFLPHRGSANEPSSYWMWSCCPHLVLPLKPEGHLSFQNLGGEMAHRCALVPRGEELCDMGVG